MSDPATDHDRLELAGRLCEAPAVTAALLRKVMNQAGRVGRPGDCERSAQIDRLIAAGASADAALALIDLALPNWHVRRIAYDGGAWYCALSRERELPDWLDQAAEAWHADLALSILSAFIEAQRISERPTRSSVPAVPFKAEPLSIVACCDNFA